MVNLFAYIPVLNQRHLDWFAKHPGAHLWLIPQWLAERVLPRLARNMAALPTEVQEVSIRNLPSPWNVLEGVWTFDLECPELDIHWEREDTWIMADEDVSHALAEKYFSFIKPVFEDIWARWDMTAVKRESPVMADVETSSELTDCLRMSMARQIGPKSPDWWRQIGVVLFNGGTILAGACNEHHPDEYTTYTFGDPRLNVDAGQKGKYCSLHSEKAVIARSARHGLQTEGASMYSTVFPCEDCARVIKEAGISEVFFEEGYSALDAQEVLRGAGIRMIQVRKDPK